MECIRVHDHTLRGVNALRLGQTVHDLRQIGDGIFGGGQDGTVIRDPVVPFVRHPERDRLLLADGHGQLAGQSHGDLSVYDIGVAEEPSPHLAGAQPEDIPSVHGALGVEIGRLQALQVTELHVFCIDKPTILRVDHDQQRQRWPPRAVR